MFQPWTVCHAAWFWQPFLHVSALDCLLCCQILTALPTCFNPGLSAWLSDSDSLASMFQPWTFCHAAWFWQPCLHVSALDCLPCCLILTALPPCFSPGLSAISPDSDSLSSMFQPWTVCYAAWCWQPCLHVSTLDCLPGCLILTALLPCFSPGLSAMLPYYDSLSSLFLPWTVRHAAWFWQPCFHVSALGFLPCCLIMIALLPCFSTGLSAMLPDYDSLYSLF
jgi:hypothetical protein